MNETRRRFEPCWSFSRPSVIPYVRSSAHPSGPQIEEPLLALARNSSVAYIGQKMPWLSNCPLFNHVRVFRHPGGAAARLFIPLVVVPPEIGRRVSLRRGPLLLLRRIHRTGGCVASFLFHVRCETEQRCKRSQRAEREEFGECGLR